MSMLGQRIITKITCFFGAGALFLAAGCEAVPAQPASPAPSDAAMVDAIPPDRVPRIALATAYAPEFAALIPELEAPSEYMINGVSYWAGRMQERDVVLFETGVSLVNATMNTERLLENFNITDIVVSGVAGGLDPDLTIGDVTVPARWAQYNESVYMRETDDGGFKPHAGVEPELPVFDFIGTRGVRIASSDDPSPQPQIWFEATPRLLSIAEKAAEAANLRRCDDEGLCLPEQPEVVVGGSGVTGSIFMDNARFRDYLYTVFEAQVVEMETAAVAMVAHAHDVPFIAFRSLSDLAGGGEANENEITAFQHLAALNSAAVVLSFLDAYGDAGAAQPRAAYCEINFSAASTYAGKALGDEFVERVRAAFRDDEAHAAFLHSQLHRAQRIASLAASQQGSEISPTLLEVWGGYKGKTSPSLAMRLPGDTTDDRALAQAVGAALGYTFMQESVLVQCSGDDAGATTHPALNLVETGSSDVLSEATVRSIFGMLLGQAEGNFDLGFTYYPDEDRFSTVGLTDGGSFERGAMTKLHDDLETVSGLSTALSLSEQDVWVSFSGNDWSCDADGAGYLKSPVVAALKPELDKIRVSFAGELESFVEAQLD
ncbi:hypothetical protein D1227_16805 [Henriciella mobilis]|nr:hypothetical protein D1231_06960 [Henriciella mobilis]RIJ19333.1 hypothetical protein D1227_16805 [Henriciella mobilis]